MAVLHTLLHAFIWPGDRFCAWVGTDPMLDSGMLRGFINSIVWGLAMAIGLWYGL